MRTTKLLIIFLLLGFTAKAQVGVNTLNPDSSAILHIYSNSKGVLLPILVDTTRSGLTVQNAPTADGLLVYDSIDKVYYFFNRATRKWLALNPFQVNEETHANDTTGDVRLAPNFRDRNVVIGGDSSRATAKLHVHGNIKSTNEIYAEDSIWSPKIGSTTASISNVHATTANINNIQTRVADIDVARVNTIQVDSIHATVVHSNSLVPIGTIIMWTPNAPDGVLNVPDCWEEVEELRGRFPVGVGSLGTDSYTARGTGGEPRIALQAHEMPRHQHVSPHLSSQSIATNSSGLVLHKIMSWGYDLSHRRSPGTNVWNGILNISDNNDGGLYTRTSWAGGKIDTGIHGYVNASSANSGFSDANGELHENRPPFYGVYFIRKISNNCPN